MTLLVWTSLFLSQVATFSGHVPVVQAPAVQGPAVPAPVVPAPDEISAQIAQVKRVYVDRLTGGETAAQMRDLLISALQGAKLFVLTENADRADAFLRGAAEDLIYTNDFSMSEGVHAMAGLGDSSGNNSGTHVRGSGSNIGSNRNVRLSAGVGENESTDISERKHEALATVRLVNKDGDVIWSTTQESTGAKFRGASADVADKITRQLTAEFERQRRSK
jgi:hypothetical protein